MQIHVDKILLLISIAVLSQCAMKKVTLTPDKSQRGDAVFGLIVPDNNYGKSEDIHIYSWTQGGELNVNRVLIDFNTVKIPLNAIIDSAFLDLYYNPTSVYLKPMENKGHQGEDSILIQRVTSDWNENTVTWNTQPETSRQNQVIIKREGGATANLLHINVKDLVQDIVTKKPSERYGMLIRYKNEKPYNITFIASGDHPDKSLHPTLTIYYRNTVGQSKSILLKE